MLINIYLLWKLKTIKVDFLTAIYDPAKEILILLMIVIPQEILLLD